MGRNRRSVSDGIKGQGRPETGDSDVVDGVVLGESDADEEADNDKEGDSDDSPSSSSSSSDSDDDTPLINNDTRLQVQHVTSERSSQHNTIKSPSSSVDESTQKETHHVYVVFEVGDNG